MNFQLIMMLVNIMAKLTVMTQTLGSSNKTMDMIITKIKKNSDNPISPVNLYTSDELIQIIVANNDRLKRGIPVIRLNPRRIKSENPILPVVTLVIKEFSDGDFSKLNPMINYNCQGYGHLLLTVQALILPSMIKFSLKLLSLLALSL